MTFSIVCVLLCRRPVTRAWSGPLYVTSGPYFGGAFNASAVTVRQVGTVRLDAGCSGCNVFNNLRFTYSVDGVNVNPGPTCTG